MTTVIMNALTMNRRRRYIMPQTQVYIPNGPARQLNIEKPSKRHERYMAEAVNQATMSNVAHRHGCVIVCSGRIVGRGYNHNRSTSNDGLIKDCCTCHAEIAALRSMGTTYCKCRGDHRYWVQRGKVSTARKKGNHIYSEGGG